MKLLVALLSPAFLSSLSNTHLFLRIIPRAPTASWIDFE